jgi:hypothetical protein
MKHTRSSAPFVVPVLRLAICALLISSASQSLNAKENKSSNKSGAIFATGAADGGRLYIRRSPVLGDNVQITLKIDGQLAGTLVRKRTYDKYITPGRHVLIASPNRSGDPWQGILNVRAGETYSYTASYSGGKLVLTPASAPH